MHAFGLRFGLFTLILIFGSASSTSGRPECPESFESYDHEQDRYIRWSHDPESTCCPNNRGGLRTDYCWYRPRGGDHNTGMVALTVRWVEDPYAPSADLSIWQPEPPLGAFWEVREEHPEAFLFAEGKMAYVILPQKHGILESETARQAGMWLLGWAMRRAVTIGELSKEYSLDVSVDTLSFAVRAKVRERTEGEDQWGPPKSDVILAMFTDPPPEGDWLNYLDAYRLDGSYRPMRVGIRPNPQGEALIPLGGCDFGDFRHGVLAWSFMSVDYASARECPLENHFAEMERMVVAANARRAAYNPIDVAAQVTVVLYDIDDSNKIGILKESDPIVVAFDHVAEIVRVKGYREQSPVGVYVERPERGVIRTFERSEANGQDLPPRKRQKLMFGDLITMGLHDGVTIRYKLLPSLWEMESEPSALRNQDRESVTVKIGVNKDSTTPTLDRTIGMIVNSTFDVVIEAYTANWTTIGEAFGGAYLGKKKDEYTEGLDPTGLVDWKSIEVYPHGTRIGLKDLGETLEIFLFSGQATVRDINGEEVTVGEGQRSMLDASLGFTTPSKFSQSDLSPNLRTALVAMEALALSLAGEDTPGHGDGERQATEAGGLPIEGAQVRSLRFFEASASGPQGADLVFQTRFDQGKTRSVYWRVDIVYPETLSEEVRFVIDAEWTDPNGRTISTQSWNAVARSGSSTSAHYLGWGWDVPGNWQPGEYTVELSVGGTRIAQGSFWIVASQS